MHMAYAYIFPYIQINSTLTIHLTSIRVIINRSICPCSSSQTNLTLICHLCGPQLRCRTISCLHQMLSAILDELALTSTSDTAMQSIPNCPAAVRSRSVLMWSTAAHSHNDKCNISLVKHFDVFQYPSYAFAPTLPHSIMHFILW